MRVVRNHDYHFVACLELRRELGVQLVTALSHDIKLPGSPAHEFFAVDEANTNCRLSIAAIRRKELGVRRSGDRIVK